MKNKMILATVIALVMVVVGVAAVAVPDDSGTMAAPSGTAINDEAGLVAAASAGGTYYLTADLILTADNTSTRDVLEGVIYISNGQALTLDLNGHSISHDSRVFFITHGTFDVTGEGTIKETADDQYSPICIKGSDKATDTNYTTVTIGKDVTLSGWAGIFITPYASSGNPHAYGVTVNFNGKIIVPISGGTVAGHGIYINGQIQDKTNYPVINISSTAEITVTAGTGIYAAGYAQWNIDGAAIVGKDSGIAIKAGILNITGGTITCNGPNTAPTEGYSNGVNASGAAIQVESNKNYAKEIQISISGTDTVITSDNGYAFYEYLASGTTATAISSINIAGGSFSSKLSTFCLSEQLTGVTAGQKFITSAAFNCLDALSYTATTAQITLNKDYTLADAVTVSAGTTLKLAVGSVLTVTSTITNNGTIVNNGTITNNGVLVNGTGGTINNTGTITNNESFVNNSTAVVGTIVNNGVCFGVTPTENNGSVSEVKHLTGVTGDIVLGGADVGKGVSFAVSSDFGVGPISVDFGNDCIVSFTPTAGSTYTVTVALDQNTVGPNGEIAYDLVVSGVNVGPVTITLPRSGSGTPYVNYVVPDGTVTAMKVESYTATTVTFVTDHNSRYLVGVTEEPTAPPVSSYRVTITPGLGYSIACSAGNVFTLSADSSMNFRICATDGYQLMGVFASNAKLVNLGGGYYKVSDVTANAVITVQVQKVSSSNDDNDDDDGISVAAIIAAAAAAAVVAACAGYVYWRK